MKLRSPEVGEAKHGRGLSHLGNHKKPQYCCSLYDMPYEERPSAAVISDYGLAEITLGHAEDQLWAEVQPPRQAAVEFIN